MGVICKAPWGIQGALQSPYTEGTLKSPHMDGTLQSSYKGIK